MPPTPRPAHARRLQRTKSCMPCVQAKRRCDPGLLACQRCTKQQLECRYASQQPSAVEANNDHILTTTTVEEHATVADSPFLLPAPDDLNLFDDFFSQYASCETFPAMSGHINVAGADQQSLIATTTVDKCRLELPAFLGSRLNYGIDELKMAPSKIVLTNGTPWSHPLLYEDKIPASMHDALAACSFYLAKNGANSGFVLRHVTLRAKELLASPNSASPLETLSRAQALLLYQIILAFDGDILARVQAEVAIPQLEAYALAIKSLLDEGEELVPTTLSMYPTGPANAAWKTWIFRESARRTFLICYFFLSLYHSLRGGGPYCHSHPEIASEWTASAHLWNAPSVFDFSVAWNDRRHLVIGNLDHMPLLLDGDPSEVDSFGRIVIVTQLGIDDARGWFHSRGGCL